MNQKNAFKTVLGYAALFFLCAGFFLTAFGAGAILAEHDGHDRAERELPDGVCVENHAFNVSQCFDDYAPVWNWSDRFNAGPLNKDAESPVRQGLAL